VNSESGRAFVARQPILDRRRRLQAYELLFRSCADATAADVFDSSQATACVAVDAFLSMGLSTVLGPHKGFLNVDLEMLASEAIEALPSSRIVLEILETVPPWALERCKELRRRGFELALDDYVPGDDRSALLDSVDFVKVDLMETGRAALPALVRELRGHDVSLLAEKVETSEEFEECIRLGFDLSQGYFFAKPTTLSGRRLDPERSALLGVFRALSEERPNAEIGDIIKRHARLGVQLLRIANSAALGSVQEITNLEHAIMYVGRLPLRRWVLLMLYASGGADASVNPVLELAAIRGRLLELLAPHSSLQQSASATNDQAFLAGVLSLGDAILDAKLAEILDELRIDSEIRSAVLERSGELGRLLQVAEHLEADRFDELSELLTSTGLSMDQVADSLHQAFAWYRQMRVPEVCAETSERGRS
jgi:EAL and modified HD-GYP domain-containing signal transduction protein